MATFFQILIAAVLSFFGMNLDEQVKTVNKEGAVTEAVLQTHNFLFPAEQSELKKWQFITTDRTLAITIIEE